MKGRLTLLFGMLAALAAATARGDEAQRSAYTYVREISGDATMESRWNGTVDVRRNMPVSAGDQLVTSEAGRVEVALADGNILHVGGGTRVHFIRLREQEGEDDEFSVIDLQEGSIVLAVQSPDESVAPRVDTDDATVYVQAGSRVRVDFDPRRGTVVIARSGTADVKTRNGSHTLRAGSYLEVQGDEEPEIARGTFSRDRFDIWSAERLDKLYETRNASARYVDEDYASDVLPLDNAGEWSYNSTYSTNVWSPDVEPGWSPYSNGSWYYTPSGLTWWSYDPWGWYPFHYGTWFFDAFWGRWCWAPASLYSPAWVYWAYSGGYVGWCPVGWYSYYSPWWDGYYKNRNGGDHHRSHGFVPIHGSFQTRNVDLRGWNFSGATTIGSRGRLDVVAGSRMGDRLGGTFDVSSRTIRMPAREGGGREAVQSFLREAPRTIQRNSPADTSRMAPILGRQSQLPPAAADYMRDRISNPARSRADTAPGSARDRGTFTDRNLSRDVPRPTTDRPQAPGDARWRSAEAPSPRPDAGRPALPAPSEDWRGRGRPSEAPPAESRGPVARDRSGSDWRSRGEEVPPARRVIEGAVPSHRRPTATPDSRPNVPAGRPSETPRREAPRQRVEPRAPAPSQPPARTERPSPPPPPQVERRAPPSPAERPEPAPHASKPNDRQLSQ
jgi:hypothetical protein